MGASRGYCRPSNYLNQFCATVRVGVVTLEDAFYTTTKAVPSGATSYMVS